MHAYLLRVLDRFFARDAGCVVLCLNLQIVSLDPGQFDDCEQLVALLEDIDRRKRTTIGGTVLEPIAGQARLEFSFAD